MNSAAKYYLSVKQTAMRRISTLLLWSALSLPVLVSGQQEKIDTAMMQRIRQEEMSHSQIAAISHQLTDVCGPRLTNSPGWHAAAAWATQTVQGWGLTKAGPEAWGEFGLG